MATEREDDGQAPAPETSDPAPTDAAPVDMASTDTASMEAAPVDAAPIQLPDELEGTVSFEIDRLNVTLAERSSWQAGGTVELARTPQDPVRILLHQGATTRVIGSGSVQVVDGRLGVQIDDWRVES